MSLREALLGRRLTESKGMPPFRITEEIRHSIEIQPDFKRFSDEARKALQAMHYQIVPLTGRSVASLRKAGFKFDGDSLSEDPGLHTTLPDTEALVSAVTEIAIRPQFLLNTFNASQSDQEAWLLAQANLLKSTVPDAETRLATMPDVVDMAFAIQELTTDANGKNGYRVFGEGLGRFYTRTSTMVEGSNRMGWIVGNHDSGYGLSIRSFPVSARAKDVGVFGMVYPL